MYTAAIRWHYTIYNDTLLYSHVNIYNDMVLSISMHLDMHNSPCSYCVFTAMSEYVTIRVRV